MIETVNGDVLEAKEQYLAHQTNCQSSGESDFFGAGVAAVIFRKYPHSNIYQKRIEMSIPGTIDVRGDGKDQRFVINMMGQVYPGKPNNLPKSLDTETARREYFRNCLLRIAALPARESIALPFGVGCGLAGGHWGLYEAMLKDFARAHPSTKVVLYRLQ